MAGFIETLKAEHFEYRCPVTLPLFSFAFGDDAVSQVHRHALNLRRAGKRGRGLKVAFLTVLWPLAALVISVQSAIIIDRKKHDLPLSRWRLGILFWAMMVRHNINVESTLRFKLWQPKNRRRVAEFIQHVEIIKLTPWLYRDRHVQEIDSKVAFAELCQRHGLPHIEILMRITAGTIEQSVETLPRQDLFSKFDGWWGGSGGLIWIYDAAQDMWDAGQGPLDEASLRDHLRHLSATAARSDTLIVQSLLCNAVEMAPYSSGALCTMRVVTTKFPDQSAQLLRGSLRMPVGAMTVDNFGAGGLGARIMNDGRLSNAGEKFAGRRTHDSHPDTGARITGATLPFWDEVRTLALTAHDCATDIYSVGWDIAWTQNGPVIVEGNVVWGEDLLQMPDCEPLGVEYCEFYLAAKEASEHSFDS
ncbi:hypothetical protein MHM39_08750 [Phaeobacter sp. CNT1-3]|nr:hypothetical protein [Phaeobacter sp. CNT1-3]